MPPKVDIATLVGKRDNAISSQYELFEELQLVLAVQPELQIIENIYKQQETMEVENFAYIRSKDNPADAVTRGISADQLKSWMKGPPFLRIPELPKEIHKESNSDIHKEEISVEMKNPMACKKPILKSKKEVNCNTATAEIKDNNPILEHLLNTCTSFSKLRRALAYVMRFVQIIRTKKARREPISVKELNESETQIFKWCQQNVDFSTFDKKLIASMDEDRLVRAHGRLEIIRSLQSDMRNPIILPRNHHLVKLLLRYLHEKRGHCGYKSLIHEARRNVWVIGLRSAAKLITRLCVTFRKLQRSSW